MDDWVLLMLIAVLLFPFTGVIKLLANHFQRMAEIKAQNSKESRSDVLREIRAMRQELTQHKEDVNEFQLGLDNRMDGLENRIGKSERPAAANLPSSKNTNYNSQR